MTYYLIPKTVLILSALWLLQACTTAAGAVAVYAISSQSERLEIEGRRYNASHSCIMASPIDPYYVGNTIAYGDPVSKHYQWLLSPGEPEEAYSDDPILPHYLAYAYLYVANQLNDPRSEQRMQWLSIYFEKGDIESIIRYINKKYSRSYLTKCFIHAS